MYLNIYPLNVQTLNNSLRTHEISWSAFVLTDLKLSFTNAVPKHANVFRQISVHHHELFQDRLLKWRGTLGWNYYYQQTRLTSHNEVMHSELSLFLSYLHARMQGFGDFVLGSLLSQRHREIPASKKRNMREHSSVNCVNLVWYAFHDAKLRSLRK